MKQRIFAIFTVCLLLIASCAGGSAETDRVSENREDIQGAIEAITQHWAAGYAGSAGPQTDGYLEIKNTRKILVKDGAPSFFEEIEYMVEFILFTDYFGSAPYYCNVNLDDTVIFYRDGRVEVANNQLQIYRSRTYTTDFSDIIDVVEDLGGAYNERFYLN